MNHRMNSQFKLLSRPNDEIDPTWDLLNDISAELMRELHSYKAPPDDEWLNSKQAAQYLKVSVAQLHNLTSAGQIPHYKMGRANRYQKSELREFLLKFPRGRRSVV